MATLHLFKSKARLMGYVFRSGKSIHFKNHQYATDNEEEIKEMERECDKHPGGTGNFYIDPAKKTIESEEVEDPNYLLREQIRGEVLAQIAAGNINKDGGTYDPTKLNPMNSQQVFATGTLSQVQAMAANPGANTPAPTLVAVPGSDASAPKPPGFIQVNLPKA